MKNNVCLDFQRCFIYKCPYKRLNYERAQKEKKEGHADNQESEKNEKAGDEASTKIDDNCLDRLIDFSKSLEVRQISFYYRRKSMILQQKMSTR